MQSNIYRWNRSAFTNKGDEMAQGDKQVKRSKRENRAIKGYIEELGF